MKLPKSDRAKALFIVDVQPATLHKDVQPTLAMISRFIARTSYDFYVVFTYYAGPDSMFYRQNLWELSQKAAGDTDSEIIQLLRHKDKPLLSFVKQTRSGFKCEGSEKLLAELKSSKIEEIHLVGFDVNDCVLATAYEAFDLGFFTYIIEEACHHNEGRRELFDAALTVLQHQNMTNNSCCFDSEEIDLAG